MSSAAFMASTEELQWGRDREVADSSTVDTVIDAIPALQWGRDREVADSASATGVVAIEGLLQWGRDREVADRVRRRHSDAGDCAASMGPRPRGRG